MKVLGVTGTPGCGCGPHAWVIMKPAQHQLLCFRHEFPQPAAEVVDKPWLTAEDLAKLQVAKFLGLEAEAVSPDHAMVRGNISVLNLESQVFKDIPTGARVRINGDFLLFSHPSESGSRSLSPLIQYANRPLRTSL